jgi:hypothetical protein
LYFRLGKALEPHTATAKEHAASMKEALNSWQQHAINVISEAVKTVQSDNKNNIKEIKNEAQKNATDLKRQLDAMNKKYIELQTEHNFARAELALKEHINPGQETTANSSKITELTLELGEQRKINEDLKLKLNALLVNFTQYRAGHLKSSLVRDVERKKEDDKNMPPPLKKDRSPSWGKTRRDTTPSSSEWDSKGDSSASCSDMDNGWGNYPQKSKVRTRSSPSRDDWRNHRQRSPANSRHTARSHGTVKRPASPARNQPPSKKSSQRDEWMNGGKEATAKWTGYHDAKSKIRSFGLSDTQNLITRVKEADSDLKEIFYKRSIPYEQRATEELSKHLSLHKELGIPAYESKKRSVSLNFYYAKVLKMCHDHVNSLRSKESTDQSMVDAFDNVIEHNKKEPNPYEHYEDSYALSSYICKLGEHSRERR